MLNDFKGWWIDRRFDRRFRRCRKRQPFFGWDNVDLFGLTSLFAANNSWCVAVVRLVRTRQPSERPVPRTFTVIYPSGSQGQFGGGKDGPHLRPGLVHVPYAGVLLGHGWGEIPTVEDRDDRMINHPDKGIFFLLH